MKEVDIAYIAGLTDGEGCLSLHARFKYGSNVYQLQISISNQHIETLQWVQSLFGGNISKKQNGVVQWRPYSVTDQVRFLKTVRPYLRIKARQADLLLAYRKTVGNGRKCSPELLKQRNAIVQEVYSLNGARTGKPSRKLKD